MTENEQQEGVNPEGLEGNLEGTSLADFFDTLKFSRRERRQLGIAKKWATDYYEKLRIKNKK